MHISVPGSWPFWRRPSSIGGAAILTEAVQAARAAAAAAPPGYPDRAGVLSNLGMVLHTLFEQLGQAAVLAEEVQATQAAVAAAGDAHPYSGKYLNNLGIALRSLADMPARSASSPRRSRPSGRRWLPLPQSTPTASFTCRISAPECRCFSSRPAMRSR